jgi:hypothetical protein
MINFNLPIPIYEVAFLQAFLYQIFSTETVCKKSFKNTEWYFNGKYSHTEVNSIIDFFKRNGAECDCDIIFKIDLKQIAKNIVGKHNQVYEKEYL